MLAKELHPRTQVEIYSADGDDLKAHLDAGTIDAAVPLARETAVTTGMLEGLPLMRPHRHSGWRIRLTHDGGGFINRHQFPS